MTNKKPSGKNKMDIPLQSFDVKVEQCDIHTPFIVAIGASAGGLETLKTFFLHAQASPNMAFIILTHLNHDHISLLPEILQEYTKMRVSSIQDRTKIENNHVYVLPPGKNVFIQNSILYLLEQKNDYNAKLPIDFFLRSLALDQGQKAICIILSGTGSDGTSGLRALREKNGLVIVQTAQSARYDGMPKSAINTGLVDYILPPEQMFSFLTKYLAHVKDKNIAIEKSISDEIQQVLLLLHTQTGHDFSSYKTNTIYRRIQKRMSILQLDSLSTYLRYLQQKPVEVDILFKELLINVTNFFRDPEAFDTLKNELEKILKTKPKEYCFRVWVPGCATGEEAYSIAIILQECMNKLKRYFNVQIFSTDIDEDAIIKARAGIYPDNIALDVSPERLKNFFVREENHFKVNIDIRKMIIFAVQNLAKDPPFTKLDLLSCRNLLIYFNSQLQKKILPLFHYSLKPHGLLFLGTSETVGGAVELFNICDRRLKIFQRKDIISSFQSVMELPSPVPSNEIDSKKNTEKNMHNNEQKLAPILKNILLENYAPPCVIVDDKENLVYVFGRTGKFLEFAPGEARLQLLDMVRTELKAKLSTAIRRVLVQQKEFNFSGIQLKEGKEFKYINLKVRPITETESPGRRLVLIIFEDMVPFEPSNIEEKKSGKKSDLDKKILELEQELKYTKESLQTTIEELETSNEELKSSNEELQSTNEELQSTNEEIETSKEELQSLNEELTTVNAELESRIEQLSSANDDIKNLLDNTEIATIFLDKDLCIKRFTPKATDIINLISSDVGRPIGHIVSNLKYEKLVDDARTVLKTLESKTTEVMDKSGDWHVIRMIPYRTVTNIIDGVVITFLNIHSMKKVEEELIKIKNNAKVEKEVNLSIINILSSPAMLVDKNGLIIQGNNLFLEKFNLKKDDLVGQSIYQIKLGSDKSKLKSIIEQTFRDDETKQSPPLICADREFEIQKITPSIALISLK